VSRIVLPALLLVSSALIMLSTGMSGLDDGMAPWEMVLFGVAFLVFACSSVLLAKAVTAARAERAEERR
jgi:uncharacterized protein (DUF58 family)